MTFVVDEKTEWPRSDEVRHKPRHITGRDLRHALELLPIPESKRRELEQKGSTTVVSALGVRRTYSYKLHIKR